MQVSDIAERNRAIPLWQSEIDIAPKYAYSLARSLSLISSSSRCARALRLHT